MAFVSTNAMFRAATIPFTNTDSISPLASGVSFIFHVELNEEFIRDNSALEPMDIWLDVCALRNSWMLMIMNSFRNEGASLLSGYTEFDDENFCGPEILRVIDCFYAGDFTTIEFQFEIRTDFKHAMIKEMKQGFDFGQGLTYSDPVTQTHWIKRV